MTLPDGATVNLQLGCDVHEDGMDTLKNQRGNRGGWVVIVVYNNNRRGKERRN